MQHQTEPCLSFQSTFPKNACFLHLFRQFESFAESGLGLSTLSNPRGVFIHY